MNIETVFTSSSPSQIIFSAKPDSSSRVILIPLIFDHQKKESWLEALKKTDAPWTSAAIARIQLLKFKCKKRGVFSFDFESTTRVVLAFWSEGSAFETLGWARSCINATKGVKAERFRLDLSHITEAKTLWCDALVSAFAVSHYSGPKYGKKAKTSAPKTLEILKPKVEPSLKEFISSKYHKALATNAVRFLTEMAGNDLTPTNLRDLALSLTKMPQISTQFLSKQELEKLSAGAFLAVVRGTEDPGVGIVKIAYQPKGTTSSKIALVGKGVTFDTGGNNLKTGGHMLGMNGDMGGSAVVLALLWLASKEKWPISITGFVTVAENVIGPKSYRPNDVVTAINGKSIEVIDTDAEGRMLLADALSLAAQEKPDLIMDFATLTGACVRAIGTAYSGVFSNKNKFVNKLIRAGKESGERVWPFPVDSDYGNCLKSKIAEIKQCRAEGGSDHIEAAYFLSQFVGKTPWVHVDLSACENEGGLAHVPGKVTGFGIRFTKAFLHLSGL